MSNCDITTDSIKPIQHRMSVLCHVPHPHNNRAFVVVMWRDIEGGERMEEILHFMMLDWMLGAAVVCYEDDDKC